MASQPCAQHRPAGAGGGKRRQVCNPGGSGGCDPYPLEPGQPAGLDGHMGRPLVHSTQVRGRHDRPWRGNRLAPRRRAAAPATYPSARRTGRLQGGPGLLPFCGCGGGRPGLLFRRAGQHGRASPRLRPMVSEKYPLFCLRPSGTDRNLLFPLADLSQQHPQNAGRAVYYHRIFAQRALGGQIQCHPGGGLYALPGGPMAGRRQVSE